VHNVDVLRTIDLRRMLEFHRENQNLATLAVQDRKTSRYLLFDDQMRLCGRQFGSDAPEMARSCPQSRAWAFSGIHVISPRLLAMINEQGAFSIIPVYLRLSAQGERIAAFRSDDYYWLDLGKPENVQRATRDLRRQSVM
jgi:NDP-sugar pyrophosphorylase family protein